MATKLGGVTLPQPVAETEGHEIGTVDVAKQLTMADGSLRVHHQAYRRRFTLKWRGLTSTERNTIWGRYVVKTTQAYVGPEDATSYTVVVTPNSWKQTSNTIAGGAYRFDVSMQLDEVTAN